MKYQTIEITDTVKSNAKTISSEIMSRNPRLLGISPGGDSLSYSREVEITSMTAIIDSWTGNTAEILDDIKEMLVSVADGYDTEAMMACGDVAVLDARNAERNFRALARTAEVMIEEGYNLSVHGTMAAVA